MIIHSQLQLWSLPDIFVDWIMLRQSLLARYKEKHFILFYYLSQFRSRVIYERI